MIKACVFDMDGTLANTIETIAYYGNTALKEAGLREIETDNYKYHVGSGYIQLVANMFKELGIEDEALFNKVASRYDEMYNKDFMFKTVAYDGVVDLVKALKENGYKIGIVSNKPHEYLVKIVKNLFGDIEFDGIEGGRENVPLKPAPAMLMKMLIDFGVSPRECIYLGDTKVDMITGITADAVTVGVLWGFRGREELESNGAQYIIETPDEVLPLLEKLKAHSIY